MRELELASTLAQVLMVTRGFTAPETRAAAERARDLAEKSGNLAQLVAQVFGIWRSFFITGDYSTAALLADRILYLAQREGSPASLGFACRAQVDVSFYRGDLARSRGALSRAGAASLTRMVSGKFPARPWLQSVPQAFARGPWVTPIQPASALPGRSPSHG